MRSPRLSFMAAAALLLCLGAQGAQADDLKEEGKTRAPAASEAPTSAVPAAPPEAPPRIAPLATWNLEENQAGFSQPVDLALCAGKPGCVPVPATIRGETVKKGEETTRRIYLRMGDEDGTVSPAIVVDDAEGGTGIAFTLLDLDRKNGTREVFVSYFTGGAHCCTVMNVFTETAAGIAKVELPTQDGDAYDGSFEIDFEKDPVFVLADDRFLYLFASYAESAVPADLRRIEGGELVDVTSDPRYRDIHRERMRMLEDGCREGGNGLCAAYVASAYRVGAPEAEAAWKIMDQHHTSRKLDPDIWLPEFCRSTPAGAEPCPEADKITFKDYPEALDYVLKDWGYRK